MKILITGAAGFIGAAVTEKLLREGNEVIGIDNINDYYSPLLKFDRLRSLGIPSDSIEWNIFVNSNIWNNFKFIRTDIRDSERIIDLFEKEHFDIVVNLAAQPGVRYSLENPKAYIENNINGFLNILEGCRLSKVKHLVFASSSSVYGLNANIPFKESQSTEHPVSLYAATKKSNEMMAHAYSQIYGLPVTGLRFFTVYGPWGRPDMSPFLFIEGILSGTPIKVFNNGNMLRDFTYIDDITEGISRILKVIPEANKEWDPEKPNPATSSAPYHIYNIGNQSPIKLLDYITTIEEALNIKAIKDFQPMQPGDVYQTFADSTELYHATGFTPSTSLKDGLGKTVKWFREYYKK